MTEARGATWFPCDAHDARAIWTAVQQPNVKAVAVKTEEQQAILALHRMRSQLVKFQRQLPREDFRLHRAQGFPRRPGRRSL